VPKKSVIGESSPHKIYATGRRKVASARIWLKPGGGQITVNGRDLNHYFSRPTLQILVREPFVVTNTVGKFDVFCTVKGSGLSGQAGAVRHGISRALDETLQVPEMHKVLRQGGLLTRDKRQVERKKYGQKKARRRFQFSKR